MLKEAIILAGGLGTRLRSVVKDVPKPMALVAGKPFLEYILDYLNNNSLKRVILAIGYKSDIIKSYFGNSYKELTLKYSEENEPLGTGGAIKQALNFSVENDILILNGDTFFNIDLIKFYEFHLAKKSNLTIALKKMENIDRYGTVEIDKDRRISGFSEKKYVKKGIINGGVYILNKPFFLSLNFVNKFSFEKDFLEKYYNLYNFYGFISKSYFIDIGIPEDYEKAKKEMKNYI
ncbi:nucleotidyltransferase family protein [Hydrogenothermus marinus]|uniref:D-glycero-alpha-D-manno-heptose 1-phosphate guanylyltransferase n=1 Tax=Hydrogenothermus marinus TaxID=133270 RepID=A0A3M0B7B8_9AQUI|nr:nucleotidyltransferase family protein [Hydrogenothermus marinus]RMA93310.1 D-glycero-alpha-D-manno-heptose 1-phosphate guanylyltransferase [Hydrogenothermus marinus]